MSKWVPVVAMLLAVLAVVAPSRAEELTLDRAIKIALENNRLLQAAQYNASAANWGLGESISIWLPHVYYNTTWSRPDDETLDAAEESFALMKQLNPNAEPSLYEDNYSSSISVIQPIFNGAREYATIRSAAIARNSAKLNAQDMRMQVALEVKKAYYGALSAKELVRVARESQALAQQSLALVKAQQEVGRVTVSDVLRWEAEAASAEGTMAEVENALAQSRMTLAQVIGEPVTRTYDLPEMIVDVDPQQLLLAERAALAGTEEQLNVGVHPAVKAEESNVKLAQVDTVQSAGALLPNINFNYTYSWETNDTLEPDEDTAWTMGISVEIPLFQSFGAISGIGRSCRTVQATRMGAESYERTFLQRSYAAKLNLRAARLRVISALKAKKHASANLEIVNNRSELGMVTSLELLDAQLAYKNAQSNLIGAISDFNTAMAEWEYVTAKAE